ncbi:biopolymer transporter ExbD [Cytophagaceae bacterium YF14B1]|uniref:Biopolymer transporter ExbD n=1 Tax=Xanthocytophaga flava TaxID=3048013 RepID=A0AAE3U963_9BACT|nr:biopolymer transporter ExbD [Xanthocytophaga flavus]MDJ1481399.1 biopolymer transporter ExbD [Xanthocytophaga flavus]
MAKVKVPRKSISLDMTAMCDVAFLLLTFFILTATAREEEPVVVDTPGSVSETVLPDRDVLVISIDKDGQVFLKVDSEKTRLAMLDKMAGRYQVSFSEGEKNQFRLTEMFGAPIANLKNVLHAKGRERAALQKGIPTDSLDNQLDNWVSYARLAQVETFGVQQQLRIVIKADKDTKYEVIQKVIDTLMKQNLNKFNLITNLEQMPAGFGGERRNH